MDKMVLIQGNSFEEIAAGLKKFSDEFLTEKPAPDFSDEKMTISQASQFIEVSYPTVCKWIREKKIPVHGKGRVRFVLKNELIEAYKNL